MTSRTRWGFVFIGVLLLVPLAGGLLRLWLSADEDMGTRVGSIEQVRDADVLYLQSERTFIVWDGDRAVALSADSPHLDHRLLFCGTAQTFVGNHGELFDRRGVYLAGPAPRSMDRHAVTVEGGQIYVDAAVVERGGDRADAAALQPEGPPCSDATIEDPPGFVGGL